MKFLFRFFEYAYLLIAAFFLFEAYQQMGQEGGKSILFLGLAGAAIFMFFFKRKFRKKIEASKKSD